MKKLFFTLFAFTTPLCTLAQEAPRIAWDETIRPPVVLAFKALFDPQYAGYTRILLATANTVIIETIKRDDTLSKHPVGISNGLYDASNTLSLIELRLNSQEPHDEMMAFVHQWIRDCKEDLQAQIAKTGEEIFFLLDDAYKVLKTLHDPSITPFAAMKIHGASRLGKMAWHSLIKRNTVLKNSAKTGFLGAGISSYARGFENIGSLKK